MVQTAPVIILCGPTAVGKTAVAIELAQKINAEIISADSGQIYRGMDIGTAKPTAEDRQKVRFHLIDILDPDEQFSAADFRTRAVEAIRQIEPRRKRAVIVAGTGLYLRALEKGLFDGPSKDPKIREELEREIERKGIESLHEELVRVDPEAAKTIPSKNRHRIIRALEVYRLTGRPISEFWKEHEGRGGSPIARTFTKFGLTLARDELNSRIDERVDQMVSRGLVAEVKNLIEKWGGGAPGLKIIGYKEIVAHLEGRISLEEAVSQIKTHSRQYAKRQMTWFKKGQDIRRVSGAEELIRILTK